MAGAFVPSSTVLQPHTSIAFLQRAGVRGADASRRPTTVIELPALLIDIQANKIATVKKCLNEIHRYGGPFNPRDLYPVLTLKAVFLRCIRADNTHSIN